MHMCIDALIKAVLKFFPRSNQHQELLLFFFNFDFSDKTHGPEEAEFWDVKYGCGEESRIDLSGGSEVGVV